MSTYLKTNNQVFEDLLESLKDLKQANPNVTLYNLLKDAAILYGYCGRKHGSTLTDMSDTQFLDSVNVYIKKVHGDRRQNTKVD